LIILLTVRVSILCIFTGSDEGGRQWNAGADDDELVQLGLNQYLVDEGTERDQVTLWEALQQQPDADLQRCASRFAFSHFLLQFD